MKKIAEVEFYKYKNDNDVVRDKVEFFIDEFENITDNNKLLEIIKMDYPFSIYCHFNGEYLMAYDGLEEFLNEDFGTNDLYLKMHGDDLEEFLNDDFSLSNFYEKDNMSWIEDYLLNDEVWSCSYKN